MQVAQRKTPDDNSGDSTPDDVTPGSDDSAAEGLAPEDGSPPATPDGDTGSEDTGSTPGEPAAAPLNPPPVRSRRVTPPPVAAEPAATARDVPGGHIAIVSHDGTILGPDDLFDDPGHHATYVVARQRIYQQFRYPNTRDPATQLLYALGVRVPRDQAEQTRHTAGRPAAEATADAGTGLAGRKDSTAPLHMGLGGCRG